jgi:hypothetical protein
MNKITLYRVVVILLVASLAAACNQPTPSPESIKINILQLQTTEISLNQLETAFSNNALTPPLYNQPSGTRLYAVVIPFDIMTLPSDASYNAVVVHLMSLKDDGTGSYSPNNDVKVITAIPLSIDRTADKDTTTNLAVGFSAVISALTGNVTVNQSTSESYQRLYRTVTAHLTPANEIIWEFSPFIDEPVLPGTYYVVAIVQCPDGTSGNLIEVDGSCSYAISQAAGLSKVDNSCGIGTTQKINLPDK